MAQCDASESWYFCHTFQPCSRSRCHWYRMLGTQWLHPQACFCAFQTSIFSKEGQKSSKNNNPAVSSFFSPLLLNRADDAFTLHLPFNMQQRTHNMSHNADIFTISSTAKDMTHAHEHETIALRVRHSIQISRYQNSEMFNYFQHNNNNNVHLSCVHQRPECSHDTY